MRPLEGGGNQGNTIVWSVLIVIKFVLDNYEFYSHKVRN
jgi:hypothetical protein